jgi:26S proteasome regulatory subunit N3
VKSEVESKGDSSGIRDETDMPSKTPRTNGTDPVENGINGTKDIEMKEDAPSSMKGGKGKKMKDGDEEMTVVLPPSKSVTLSAPPPSDQDGDAMMEDSEKAGDEQPVELGVNLIAKTVSSRCHFPRHAVEVQ